MHIGLTKRWGSLITTGNGWMAALHTISTSVHIILRKVFVYVPNCRLWHINTLTRKVSVCLSVTDVTHFRNVYSGNEASTYTLTRTLGTSLLAERRRDMAGLSRHTHSYRRATKAGQSTLEQAKTVLSTSRTLSQDTKVRLRYKRVDFLGTANRNFQIMVDNVDLHRR